MTNILEDGWVPHPAPYSTPPVFTSAYKFGLNLPDKKAPLETPVNMDLNQTEVLGQYFFDLSKGDLKNEQHAIRFIPVNGLPLYWFYGKATEKTAPGSEIYVVENMDGSERKPRLGTWQKTADQNLAHEGVAFNDYSMGWARGGFLGMSLLGKGLKFGEGSAAATSPASYTFPDSVQDGFFHMDSMSWAGGSLFPSMFTVGGTQVLTSIPGNDGFNQEITEFNPQKGAVNIQCGAANGEALMADALAGTKRDFIWKILKASDPTLYIQLTATNAMINTLIPDRVQGRDTIYSGTIALGAVEFEIKDGITTEAFYGL